MLTIGAPSIPVTAGGPVSYAVTYADVNFGSKHVEQRECHVEPDGDGQCECLRQRIRNDLGGDAFGNHRRWDAGDFDCGGDSDGFGRQQRGGGWTAAAPSPWDNTAP